MSNNQSNNMTENPLRGFAFAQFSNTFNNMLYHFGDNVEIVCMSVQFPTLCQKRAQTILRTPPEESQSDSPAFASCLP